MVRLIRVGPMHGVRAIKTQVQESSCPVNGTNQVGIYPVNATFM